MDCISFVKRPNPDLLAAPFSQLHCTTIPQLFANALALVLGVDV
jgi:hypothetical protein